MKRFLVVALIALPSIAGAQKYTQKYTNTTLSDVFAKWDKVSADEGTGMDVLPVEKLHFVARYMSAPVPCKSGGLAAAFAMQGYPDMMKRIAVNHCIELGAEGGRIARVYVQDVLVPGLQQDVEVGGMIDIHADFVGYEIMADRTKNHPIMMINGFEPVKRT